MHYHTKEPVTVHPDDYEVICNVCDLRAFRATAVAVYRQTYQEFANEELALREAVAVAVKLNAINDGDIVQHS